MITVAPLITWIQILTFIYRCKSQFAVSPSRIPAPIAYHTTAIYNDTLTVIGGCSDGNIFYKYSVFAPINPSDSSLGSWSSFALSIPLGVTELEVSAEIAQVANLLYFINPEVTAGTATDGHQVFIYDLITHTFTNADNKPETPGYHGCSVYDSDQHFIYHLGGKYRNGGSVYSDKLQQYDIGSNIWTQKTTMVKGKYWAGCANTNTYIYDFGGRTTSSILDDIHKYDIAQDSWSATLSTTLSVERYAFICRLLPNDGYIYCIGGSDQNDNPLDSVDVFNPLTDTMVDTLYMNYRRGTPQANIYGDDCMIIAGGLDGDVYAGPISGFLDVIEYLGDCTASTLNPTKAPTLNPSVSPVNNPTVSPTETPTPIPTLPPTNNPTSNPSNYPTVYPTTDLNMNNTYTTEQSLYQTTKPSIQESDPTQAPTVGVISVNYTPSIVPTRRANEGITIVTETHIKDTGDNTGKGISRQTLMIISILTGLLVTSICCGVLIFRSRRLKRRKSAVRKAVNMVRYSIDNSTVVGDGEPDRAHDVEMYDEEGKQKKIQEVTVTSKGTSSLKGPMDNGNVGICTDCGNVMEGKTDETDGAFYCWECWESFNSDEMYDEEGKKKNEIQETATKKGGTNTTKVAKDSGHFGVCADCGNEMAGKMDETDGSFYCWKCWALFSSDEMYENRNRVVKPTGGAKTTTTRGMKSTLA